MSFKVSVPGKVTLLGEHAVLFGYQSVFCAVDRRLFVELIPRKDKVIYIRSALGEYTTDIDFLEPNETFRFVLAALQSWKHHLSTGCDLFIRSTFSSDVGLGSSSAVTVGVLAVLQRWINGQLYLDELYRDGVAIIKAVQRVGSGADVAASVYGGVIAYRIHPTHIEKLRGRPKITLIYVGYKTPTMDVIEKVAALRKDNPKRYEQLFLDIDQCAKLGIVLIQEQNWRRLGEIFVAHQCLQEALGVSDCKLEKLIEAATALPNILGAKISGSGLGDCIVVLGKVPANFFPMNEEQRAAGIKQFDVSITEEGVRDETS